MTPQKDAERIAAERRALELASKLKRGAGHVADVSSMSDRELSRVITQMRIRLEHEAPPMPRKKQSSLSQLRSNMVARKEVRASICLRDLERVAYDIHGISVGNDGLVEVERVTPDVASVIGSMPVALYHHTSSALLPKIRKDGLIIGKQTNFFNTQAGVYLSTRNHGEPVDVYSKRAVHVYGGNPVALRVRRTLDQLRPDPDDADLAWAQGVQFISQPVPPSDIEMSGPNNAAAAKTAVKRAVRVKP